MTIFLKLKKIKKIENFMMYMNTKLTSI